MPRPRHCAGWCHVVARGPLSPVVHPIQSPSNAADVAFATRGRGACFSWKRARPISGAQREPSSPALALLAPALGLQARPVPTCSAGARHASADISVRRIIPGQNRWAIWPILHAHRQGRPDCRWKLPRSSFQTATPDSLQHQTDTYGTARGSAVGISWRGPGRPTLPCWLLTSLRHAALHTALHHTQTPEPPRSPAAYLRQDGDAICKKYGPRLSGTHSMNSRQSPSQFESTSDLMTCGRPFCRHSSTVPDSLIKTNCPFCNTRMVKPPPPPGGHAVLKWRCNDSHCVPPATPLLSRPHHAIRHTWPWLLFPRTPNRPDYPSCVLIGERRPHIDNYAVPATEQAVDCLILGDAAHNSKRFITQ